MNDVSIWSWSCIFTGVTGLAWVALSLWRREDGRIDRRVRGVTTSAARSSPAGESPTGADHPMQMLEKLVVSHGSAQEQLRRRLQQAGYTQPSAPATFSISRYLGTVFGLGLAVLASRLVTIKTADLFLISMALGGLGFLLPGFWLERRKAARQRVLLKSLPDFLDLLVACLEAGLGLEGAIQRISTELGDAHPALAREVSRAQREMELGTPTDRALMNFADRVDLEPIRTLSTVCNQSRRFGTRISVALRVQADMLRTTREEAAEEAAQKASVKILIPTLLLLFPATFVVLAGPAAIQIYERFQTSSANAR